MKELVLKNPDEFREAMELSNHIVENLNKSIGILRAGIKDAEGLLKSIEEQQLVFCCEVCEVKE